MKDRLEALKHSANFDDDETQDFDEPSTVIDEENTFMDNFFQRVATIRGNIDKIAQDVEQVKKMYSQMLSAAVRDQEVKDELERLMYDVRRTANSVRTNLKEMEQRINQQDMDSSCNNYAESRIRRCQHSALTRKFVEVMSDYYTAQSDYREKCISRIQRQLEITGKTMTSDEVEEMLEGGDPTIFKSDIVIETKQARQALGDIEVKHRDIINQAKIIQELHEMLLDMAMVVESQEEMIDGTEYNVEQAVDFVQSAQSDTTVQYQSKAGRKKILIIVCLIVFVAITVAIVVSVVTTSRLEMYAKSLTEAVKPDYKRQIIHDEV